MCIYGTPPTEKRQPPGSSARRLSDRILNAHGVFHSVEEALAFWLRSDFLAEAGAQLFEEFGLLLAELLRDDDFHGYELVAAFEAENVDALVQATDRFAG